MKIRNLLPSIVQSFLSRVDSGDEAPELIENPSEEIEDALKRGKGLTVHRMAAGVGLPRRRRIEARLEENYLFSTRRFPAAVGNVLPAAPHIVAGIANGYFTNAVGQPGEANGFPTGFILGLSETNMDIPSQISKGKDFVFHQVGVSFNAEALSGDIEQMLDAGSLVFIKQGGQFTLRHGPMSFWPGGTGVSGMTTNQNTESAHNGIADIRSARALKVPRVIKNQEVFQYNYDVARNTRATDGTNWTLSAFTLMRVWLWGGQRDSIPV